MSHRTELDRVMREQGRMNTWLAEQVGAHKSSVTYWRQGKRRPAGDTRLLVALALGRSVRDADALFQSPVTSGHHTAQEVPS